MNFMLIWAGTVAFLVVLTSWDALVELLLMPRRLLLSRLVQTRLYKLMLRRQVELGTYLTATSRTRTLRCVRRCELCTHKARCDAELRAAGDVALSFCPNRELLSLQ